MFSCHLPGSLWTPHPHSPPRHRWLHHPKRSAGWGFTSQHSRPEASTQGAPCLGSNLPVPNKDQLPRRTLTYPGAAAAARARWGWAGSREASLPLAAVPAQRAQRAIHGNGCEHFRKGKRHKHTTHTCTHTGIQAHTRQCFYNRLHV